MLHLGVCINKSHHILKLVRQWEFPNVHVLEHAQSIHCAINHVEMFSRPPGVCTWDFLSQH